MPLPSIAFAEKQFLFYEGEFNWWHGLWPSPVLSIATLLGPDAGKNLHPTANDLHAAELVFREDSFDPVTRIRRGRLYKAIGERPKECLVQKHPANEIEMGCERNQQELFKKRLFCFDAWRPFAEPSNNKNNLMIALGTQQAYTLWRVVDVERIVTGEDLITLRARNSLGLLPELNTDAIPVSACAKALETMDKLSEAAYRAGPESIVDRARDAAQWCLGAWLAGEKGDEKLRHEDLGHLASKLDEDRMVSRSVAQAIARLHARGKPNEQDKRNLRPVIEADAEFALAAMGLLLRELGWAI
jgi:hypothetical protein